MINGCGEIGGMTTGKENRGTGGNHSLVSKFPATNPSSLENGIERKSL
jgi:hypothetical protein